MRPTEIALVFALLALVVVGAGITLGSKFDHSPQRSIERFVHACLSSDDRAPMEFLPDEPAQHASFAQWRTWHFPSIRDAHRPAGDKVKVEAELITTVGEASVFRVQMRSPFIGSREHTQAWRLADGRWLFDAHQTMEPLAPKTARASAASDAR